MTFILSHKIQFAVATLVLIYMGVVVVHLYSTHKQLALVQGQVTEIAQVLINSRIVTSDAQGVLVNQVITVADVQAAQQDVMR